jgi:DNA-binding response OmpR family regulator
MARILLVDDDIDLLKFGQEILASVDHEAVVAQDATRALEYLNNHPFDLVISDANMPFISGFELVKTIRKNPKWQDLTVALLTGRRGKEDVRQAIQAGVDDYIVKPIDPLLFLNKIETLLDKRDSSECSEYLFEERDPSASGTLQVEIQLISISEMGLSYLSNQPTKSGKTVEIEAPLFEELDMSPPPMKVIGCQKIGENLWSVRTVYCGTTDAELQKLRSWMLRKMGQKRANHSS